MTCQYIKAYDYIEWNIVVTRLCLTDSDRAM